MSLKLTLTEEEHGKLADPLKTEYTKADDGSFTLSLDGEHPEVAAYKTKLGEFRTTNTALQKERDDAKKALEEAKKLAEGSGSESDKLAARLKAFEANLAAEKEAREKAEGKLLGRAFDDTVTKAAKKAGVTDAAVNGVLLHVKHVAGLKPDADGNPAAPEGSDVTLESVLKQLKKDSPFYFAESNGGGTPPSGKPRGKPGAKTVGKGSILKNREAIIKGEAVYDPNA